MSTIATQVFGDEVGEAATSPSTNAASTPMANIADIAPT